MAISSVGLQNSNSSIQKKVQADQRQTKVPAGFKLKPAAPKTDTLEFKGSVITDQPPKFPPTIQATLDKIDEFISDSKKSPLLH